MTILGIGAAKKGMPATKQRVLAWADVVQGVVQVEFNRPDGGDDLDGDLDAADDDPTDDDPTDDGDDVTDGRS